ANAVVVDRAADLVEEEHGEVLGRRVQLDVERRELVDVLVVEVVDDALGRVLEVAKVDEQADVVQSLAADMHLDLVVVAVRVLALSAVPAQRMRARKLHLDADFVHVDLPSSAPLRRKKHYSIVAGLRPGNRRQAWPTG